MNLPDGVSYHPRQARLIARDQNAIIRIDTAGYPANSAYEVKDRLYPAVARYFRGDWEDFDRLFRISPQRRVGVRQGQGSDVLYSGAEHSGHLKLPNITVVPNWFISENRGLDEDIKVLGCTMGHFHPPAPSGRITQEVYEFQSYGLFVLDRENGEVEVWVAKGGDKIAVPDKCHMTLYNIGDEDNPLVTLDFAHPDPTRNPSNKKLIEQCGPILLGYYSDFGVVFKLNRLYVNNPTHGAGVRLKNVPEEAEREVRIALGARSELGRLLYEDLTRNSDLHHRFGRLGLHIRQASPESAVEPVSPKKGERLYFSLPLVEAVKPAPATEMYRYFLNGTPPKPGEPRSKGLAATGTELAESKQRHFQLEVLNRRLVIVVEGGGDWVTKAYRPLFCGKAARLANGYNLAVFYADDSRWSGRPTWADNLEPWETYLDKADPSAFAKYENLLADVVFVITPDFTHASIARRWLGRSSIVFVEKPFDSQLSNVEDLLQERGRGLGTSVLGLDHYQLNAIRIHELMPSIEKHLGGAIAQIVFYMTETAPIERERVRTLQYGLTLDFLPHCLALLDYFGDVRTIDEISVLEAGQYDPLVAAGPGGSPYEDISKKFRNETYSHLKFTFQDYSGNGYHIPCTAVVGKGFSQAVKYLEAIGRNGNTLRVDLTKAPTPDPAPGYPWFSLLFLDGSTAPSPGGSNIREIADPYNSGRILRILEAHALESMRYEKLLDDLMNGTRDAAASTMTIGTACELVRGLDRVWRAIQDARPRWNRIPLSKVHPVHWIRTSAEGA